MPKVALRLATNNTSSLLMGSSSQPVVAAVHAAVAAEVASTKAAMAAMVNFKTLNTLHMQEVTMDHLQQLVAMGNKVASTLDHQLLPVAILHRNSGAEMSLSFSSSIIKFSTSNPPILLHCLFRTIIQIMLLKFTSQMDHSSSPSMALSSQRRTRRDHTVHLLQCPLSHNSSGKQAQDLNLSPLSIMVTVAAVEVVAVVAQAVVVLTPL